MSEVQEKAQQLRRAKERSERGDTPVARSAANAAEAAARSVPDGPIAFEPDPEATRDTTRTPDAPLNIKRGNPVRTAAYDEIAKERQTRRDNEVHEQPRPEAAAPAPTPTPAAEPPPQPAEPAAVEPPAPKTVKVKIDGQESDVPESEVEEYGSVKAYQIHKAAEKRYAEAQQMQRDATALLTQAKTMAAPPKPAEPPKKLHELVQEYMPRVQYGTPEESAQAFAEAIERAVTHIVPKVDQNQAAAQAYMLTQVSAAENKFVRDNPDLVAQPLLKGMIIQERNRRVAELKQQGRLPDDWDAFYTSIALDVRTAIGRPPTTGAATVLASQPTSGLAEKEARKASIVALPTAAARAAAPEEEKPLTREQQIAKARSARGQPT